MFPKLTSLARLGLPVYLASVTVAAAEPVAVKAEGLRSLVPGAHIELDTPLNTVIPIRFTADGLMTGEANGLASYLGAEKDRGRWRISGDQLCLKWFRWFDAEERCLVLKQDDTRIFWQEPDGKSGTATLIKREDQVAKAAPSAPAKFAVAAVSAPAKASPPTASAPVTATASTPAVGAPAAGVPAAVAPAVEEPDGPPVVLVPPPATAEAVTAPVASGLNELTIISRAEAAVPPATQAPTAPAEAASPVKAKTTVKAVEKAADKTAKKVASSKQTPDKSAAKAATSSKAARASSAPPAVASPTYQVAHVEEDDVLNIRSGPSEDHEAIGEIPPEGRGVKIVGPCEGDWCPIAHGRSKGWVNRYYLAEEVAAQTASKRPTARATR